VTALKPTFRFALVLLTNRCNLACRHCYVESGPKGHEGLPRERVLRLSDELHELYGRMFFALSGGEALVRQEDCFAVIAHAVEKHHVQLVSNGTLIDRETARRLRASGASLKISLDGADANAHDWMRGKGSFAATMRGVRTLFEEGFPAPRLALGATIPPDKVSQIDALLKLATDLGVDRIRFDSVAKIGRARHFWPHVKGPHADEDAEPIRQYFDDEFVAKHASAWRLVDLNECVGMFETLHVYYDGDVHLYLNYDHPIAMEGRIGNLHDSTLRDIVQSPAVTHAILRKFLQFSQVPTRSFISYYATRKSSESSLWFEPQQSFVSQG
jgi:MoaA/NifB/PqqE/SkfB family radical SAM enzyme